LNSIEVGLTAQTYSKSKPTTQTKRGYGSLELTSDDEPISIAPFKLVHPTSEIIGLNQSSALLQSVGICMLFFILLNHCIVHLLSPIPVVHLPLLHRATERISNISMTVALVDPSLQSDWLPFVVLHW
jgi:hypothetical protein